jgi:hypothetical protein
MENSLLQAIVQLAPSITTSSMLLLAWMLERRRADRLEAIALNRQEQKERLEILQKGEV